MNRGTVWDSLPSWMVVGSGKKKRSVASRTLVLIFVSVGS